MENCFDGKRLADDSPDSPESPVEVDLSWHSMYTLYMDKEMMQPCSVCHY